MHSRDSRRVTVRRRTDADINACMNVLAEVHEHDAYPRNWPDNPRAWLSYPELIAAWVAEIDGEIVGQVGLARPTADDVAPDRWSSRTGSDRGTAAVIARLFVRPNARGRGLAAALMSEAEQHARQQGTHPVLDVVEDDDRVVAFYERLGWAFLGSAEQRWGPDQIVTVRCYTAPRTTASGSP